MLTDTTKIERVLERIADDVADNIENINCGGCAVYAVELAKRLDAIGITNYKIRTYGYSGSEKTNVSTVERKVFNTNLPKYTEDWGDNGVYFSHVRLEWNGKVWDAEGATSSRKAGEWNYCYYRQRGHISRKAIEKLLPLQCNWNSMFNRRQVPKLKRIMDKWFGEANLAA